MNEQEHTAATDPLVRVQSEVSSGGEEAATSSPNGSMLALIDRYARDPSVDIEKFERLLAMKERMEAREAAQQFNAAKSRIKKRLADIKIVKNKAVLYEIEKGKPEKGKAEAFRYAPLEEIDKHLAPLLAEESMEVAYTVEPREGGGGLVTGRLKHLPSGHFEDSTMPLPLDTTGGKSNIQAMGSTNSYGRRYIKCNLFDIVVIGDDDDGTGGTIDEGQARYIRDLLKQCGDRDPERFAKYMKADSVEQIRFRDYRKATSALEEAIQKIAKARVEKQMRDDGSSGGLMGEP